MEAGPARLDAAAGRGGQVAPEGGHRPRPGRPDASSSSRPTSSWAPCCSSTSRCPSAPTPTSPTSTASSTPGRVVGLDHRRADRRLGVGQQVRPHRRAARRRPAHRLRAPADLAVVGVVIQAGTLNLQGMVDGPGRGRDLRLGRDRQPVLPHPDRRARRVPDRQPGRAHPDPVRHADRRVRAGHRLHHRVHRPALPAVLHRRVRARRARSPPSPPRCSSAAGTFPASTSMPTT